jgi:uncharacterized protein YdeI (YjbR/CyaY-like superfamily)
MEEHVLELPASLEAAFRHHQQAKNIFDQLSFSHRMEYVQWIGSAKREETRNARIEKCLQMLLEKTK